MSEKILVAAIAGSVSLVVALFGLLAGYFQHRNAIDKLKVEIDNKYNERLYEKRINLYPEAFRIASRIKKLKKPELIIPKNIQEEILKELNVWAEGDAGLFMSNNTIKCYFELRESLGNNPGDGEFYTHRQVEKIWEARTNFRKALRADVGNLHKAEQ